MGIKRLIGEFKWFTLFYGLVPSDFSTAVFYVKSSKIYATILRLVRFRCTVTFDHAHFKKLAQDTTAENSVAIAVPAENSAPNFQFSMACPYSDAKQTRSRASSEQSAQFAWQSLCAVHFRYARNPREYGKRDWAVACTAVLISEIDMFKFKDCIEVSQSAQIQIPYIQFTNT